MIDYHKAPFPWFGGKQHAAPIVWAALGDVEHYVEPFAGSLATLLLRPHKANRTYYSETVNDLDGLIVNFWRAVRQDADAVADAASWPVSEADLHARHLRLVKWKTDNNLELLMGDPDWCDPQMAGWWAWGQSSWIGSGWCSGTGAWTVGHDGRIRKMDRDRSSTSVGVQRQRPHINNDGVGVNHGNAREPGVWRKLPNLTGDRGINRPQLREPGVSRQLPHLGDDGRGTNRPQLREPGVSDVEQDWHPMTMPELRNWLRFLQARLRHVRILNGSWDRLCTLGALKTLGVRQGDGAAGVFLDPPYSTDVREDGLYARDSSNVAADVRRWCIENDKEPNIRIVLAGFAGEGHEQLVERGWREVEWFKAGFLRGGMANTNASGEKGSKGRTTQKQERLWLSPGCRNIDHDIDLHPEKRQRLVDAVARYRAAQAAAGKVTKKKGTTTRSAKR